MQDGTVQTILNDINHGNYERAVWALLNTISDRPIIQESKLFKVKTTIETRRGFATITARLPVSDTGDFLQTDERAETRLTA